MSQTAFRYQLQPYKPGQKKTCPGCGQSKCYVQYIDTETGNLLPYEYGRCERQNNCGYHKAPDNVIREEDKQGRDFVKTFVMQEHIDDSLVKATFTKYQDNPFALFLAKQFGSKIAADAIRRYLIGTGKNNATIFWHRNRYGKYCNGKRIFYGPDGKRLRDQPPTYTHLTAKGFKICLFGEHLITRDKPIAIVESEKSAVICSIYRPELTWLASGGSNGLTHEKMAPLDKKQVLLFPDFDQAGRTAFKTAYHVLRQLAFPEIVDILPDISDGTDIADLYLMTPLMTENKVLIGPEGFPANWN